MNSKRRLVQVKLVSSFVRSKSTLSEGVKSEEKIGRMAQNVKGSDKREPQQNNIILMGRVGG